jgi:mono/diheme cytochrome c family protein
MKRQPKYKSQHESEFFPDTRTSRMPVDGTIARGQLVEDDTFVTGIENGLFTGKNPLPLTPETLALGQKRFTVYCTPCHDATGSGRGVVPIRTNWLPTNLQEDRVRNMVDGEIFNVLYKGRRNMPSYRFQISTHDRWAIVYYVRALQRASRATVADVPSDRAADVKEPY